MDPVEQIAAAVLYEGYILWPYRRSARKNRLRWTFGGVYPRDYSEARGGDDPWLMQTEQLVRGEDPLVSVQVRFLQVVERNVGRPNDAGTFDLVDELQVGGERYLSWDEARERQITVDNVRLAGPDVSRRVEIVVPGGREEEPIIADDESLAGALIRSWLPLEGTLEIESERVGDALFRLRARIVNTTPWDGQDRESTLRQTFVSTHTILRVEAGELVSMTDPPEDVAEVAAGCENIKTWPVLAGEDGSRDTVLSSPIILYDYPKIAPESPGDLFDGTEIDQLLVLNILTLTDEEKAEMRATDPRTREILERTEALTADDFMSLHGTFRDFRMLGDEPDIFPGFEELERPPPECVLVNGVEIRKGSKVRLRPRPGGDIFDIALDGKVAFIEAIEQDYEDQIHLSVTVEEDPGRDLGAERILGHRFFFSPDEVEPLDGVSERLS